MPSPPVVSLIEVLPLVLIDRPEIGPETIWRIGETLPNVSAVTPGLWDTVTNMGGLDKKHKPGENKPQMNADRRR
jgi:hypothetical protein